MYDPARDIFKADAPAEQGQQQQSRPDDRREGRRYDPISERRNEDSYSRDPSRRDDSRYNDSPEQQRKRPRQDQREREERRTSGGYYADATQRRRGDEEGGYAGGDRYSRDTGPRESGNLVSPRRAYEDRGYNSRQGDRGESGYERDRRRQRNGDAHGNEERRVVSPRMRRNRSRSPSRRDDAHKQRFRYRDRTPPPIFKEPSPPPAPPPPSPPRQRKRPGQASRISQAEKEAFRKKKEEQEREAEKAAMQAAQSRGVEEVVRTHYNEKKERGREWRATESKIKGLRMFNNWIKSVVIQKFGPSPEFIMKAQSHYGGTGVEPLLVLDMGCGRGGDLKKWHNSPQQVDLYVGIDPADVSISVARDRHTAIQREVRRGRKLFQGNFFVMDAWTQWIGSLPFMKNVGIDESLNPALNRAPDRWSPGGNFDVVSMMFCLHYSFESEAKARGMLRNVVSALKKGGRFFGTIPDSNIIAKKLMGPRKEGEPVEWGNSIYRVRFSTPPSSQNFNGVFNPPFGHRYSYYLEEAVEEVPEYVVPWEAFRAMCEDFGLEFLWKKGFHDIYKEECNGDLAQLSERMGVKGRDGKLLVTDEEWEAAGFYVGFAFRRV